MLGSVWRYLQHLDRMRERDPFIWFALVMGHAVIVWLFISPLLEALVQ